MNKRLLAWVKYALIGGALFGPALVVAQSVPQDFRPGTLLTSSGLNQVLEAMRGIDRRLATVETRPNFASSCRWTSPIVYCPTALTCTASCASNEIAVSGGCDGTRLNGVDTLVRESRVNDAANPTGWICESPGLNIGAQAFCCPR